MNGLRWLLFLAFALTPLISNAAIEPKASEPPKITQMPNASALPKLAQTSEYVFIGSCFDETWSTRNIDSSAVLKCPSTNGNYALPKPIEVMLGNSLKVHNQPTPSAAETKRVLRQTKVTIYGLHVCGDQNVRYVWGDIGRSRGDLTPARYFGEMEEQMKKLTVMTYKLRCGCDASAGVLLSTDVDGTISECQSCGAAWSEFAERLTKLDFGPIGGPRVRVLLPYSSPA